MRHEKYLAYGRAGLPEPLLGLKSSTSLAEAAARRRRDERPATAQDVLGSGHKLSDWLDEHPIWGRAEV